MDSIRVKVKVGATIDVGARVRVSITCCVGARFRVTDCAKSKGSVMVSV